MAQHKLESHSFDWFPNTKDLDATLSTQTCCWRLMVDILIQIPWA